MVSVDDLFGCPELLWRCLVWKPHIELIELWCVRRAGVSNPCRFPAEFTSNPGIKNAWKNLTKVFRITVKLQAAVFDYSWSLTLRCSGSLGLELPNCSRVTYYWIEQRAHNKLVFSSEQVCSLRRENACIVQQKKKEKEKERKEKENAPNASWGLLLETVVTRLVR